MCSAPTGWRAQGKQALRAARAGLRRLVRHGAAEAFRPDYSDAALIAALARNGSDASAAWLREWQAGAREAARRRIVEHFDRETRSRFFFDTADAPSIAAAVTQASGGWRDRLEQWTTGVTTKALEVYGHPIAPLRPGFPWAGVRVATLDDVLFAARPHRFAFAPPLACATLVGSFPASGFRELLLDWCAFTAGDRPHPAFISTLVVTQRLLACSWAYAMLGPVEGEEPSALVELKWQLLKLMGQDIAFLEPRLGGSYPNNHLLVDRFAAWYVAALLPELRGAHGASDDTERLWLAECERQTYPDGGYFEPSVRYHGLASELVAAYVLLSRRHGRLPSDWVRARHEAMLRFQATLAGPDGQPPEIGDGTEDPMFPLVQGARSAQGLSALYRMQRGGGLKARAPSAGREWALWMLGGRVEAAVAPPASEGFAAFADMGVFVFSEDGGRTRLVLRTAPAPERAVMPGHMHSDLMSIYFIQSGTPLVVDSGTFTYRFGNGASGTTNWRAYFAGASAHNTVLIAGQDPLGALTGDFRSNVRVPRAQTVNCRVSPGLAAVAARLEGDPPYAGLMRGVVHVREEYFLVWSALPDGAAADDARFLFQLAPGTELLQEPSFLRLERTGVSMDMACSSALEAVATRHGSEDPASGSVSLRYGEIAPAPQLVFRAAGGKRFSAVLFRRSSRPSLSSLACELIGDRAGSVRVEGAEFSDLIVVNFVPREGNPVLLEGGLFDGEVLWVRKTAAGALVLRALAARMVILPAHGVDLRSAVAAEDLDYSRPT